MNVILNALPWASMPSAVFLRFCPSPVKVRTALLASGALADDFSGLNFHVPISALGLWPNPGSVKPIATMMPRHDCFIGFLHTGAIARREGTLIKRIFSKCACPPWAFPAAVQFTGFRHTRWQLVNKIPPAGTLAYRPFGGGSTKKCYAERPG